MKLLFGIGVLMILSCNVTWSNDKVAADKAAIQAKMETLRTNMNRGKSNFEALYQKKLIQSKDSMHKWRLIQLGQTILSTSAYLDSLQATIANWDQYTSDNTMMVEAQFLENSVADTIYNKLELAFYWAQTMAPTITSKALVVSKQRAVLNTQDKNKWKYDQFWMVSPLDAYSKMYNWQTQLIEAGYTSLKYQ